MVVFFNDFVYTVQSGQTQDYGDTPANHIEYIYLKKKINSSHARKDNIGEVHCLSQQFNIRMRRREFTIMRQTE